MPPAFMYTPVSPKTYELIFVYIFIVNPKVLNIHTAANSIKYASKILRTIRCLFFLEIE